MTVSELTLSQPLNLTGRTFKGSYDNTSKYLDQVKEELKKVKIDYNEMEAVSIYLSDPESTSADQLESFHGFVTKSSVEKGGIVTRQLKAGRYIISKTKDVTKIWDSFGEAYQYAGQKQLQISDVPPVLITTVEDKTPLFTMYFPIQ
jgi:DNA gyrase inhibitor GyrI